MIKPAILEAKISDLLDVFYAKRVEKLGVLKLKSPLKRKNPYLYRAIGVGDVSEIVGELLQAHVSSSDETLFGNEFFEPLAKWVAEVTAQSKGGNAQTASGEGIDLAIEYELHYEAIAVKSGVNVFNASSRKKQGENFDALRKRLQKLQKRYDPIVGYCYGRKTKKEETSGFEELAGQRFWQHLSGEADFYTRILDLMKEKPALHSPAFKLAYENAKNRLVLEFAADFCKNDGSIDWVKLTEFNSSTISPKPEKKSKT